MKLWKTILIAISVTILPLALVGIGQAQQLNCWGLRPNLTVRTENADFPEQLLPQEGEDDPELKSDIHRPAEDENDAENTGSS